jgi:uncharacterized membrane protein
MTERQDEPRDYASSFAKAGEMSNQLWETVRRAFVEFLTIPTLVIVGFLALALVMFILDEARIASKGPASKAMWGGLFSDAQATRDFLGVIAASIITVTSITLSLLLIAVQQGAASLTSLVFDQFLRRRANQLYFGFFIGLALYSLIVLTSITPSHQPIYGVAMAGVMTVVALYMLIILIYTTIDQMRPVVIIKITRCWRARVSTICCGARSVRPGSGEPPASASRPIAAASWCASTPPPLPKLRLAPGPKSSSWFRSAAMSRSATPSPR